MFAYFTARHGYRGGGFNSPDFSPVLAEVQNFSPEKLTDFEIGIKANFDTGGIAGRFNIAAYRGKYSNIQQNVSVPVNLDGDDDPTNDPAGQTIIANGGKARIQGVEIDAALSPFRALTLGAVAAYTDAEYTDTQLPPILKATFGSADFQYTPDFTYTLSARLNLPVPEEVGDLSLFAELYHSDSYIGQQLQIEGYEVVNARAQWSDILGAPIDASLFVRNLFDKDYIVAPGVANFGLGYLSAVYADPRTYGMRLRYRFGGY